MALIILFVLIVIIKDLRRAKKRRGKVIVRSIRTVNSNLVSGFFWLVSLLIWVILLSQETLKLYDLFNKEYITGVYQLFDFGKLKSLQQYFFEQQMIRELSEIAFYRSALFQMLIGIMMSCCLTVLNFYRGWRRNEISDGGIVVSGNNISWEKITGFSWGKYQEGSRLNKDTKYYDLSLRVKHGKVAKKIFREDTYEVKLRIAAEEYEAIDKYLKSVTEQLR
ncbi:MAG: hypothetical protein ACOWWO_11580 [Peptococcaceae bacterium]